MRCAFRVVLGIGLAALFALAAAAEGDAPATGKDPAPRENAPLRLGNRTIFEFHAPSLGYPARDRAAVAAQRLEAALEGDAPAKVATKNTSEGTLVTVDDKFIFLVGPADVEKLAGETPESVAAGAARALEQAIGEHREQSTPRELAIALGLTALATLLWGAILRGLFLLNRWGGQHIARAVTSQVQRVEHSGVKLLEPMHFLTVTRVLFAVAIWAVALAITNGWLTFVLERFPYTRPWGEQLQGHFVDLIAAVLEAILSAVPGLVVIAIIALIARLIVRAISVLFDRVEDGRVALGWLDRDTARPTRRIATVVVWLIALAMAYPYLPGAQTDAFKGVSVLVGLMLSIGASSIVGQAASGLILMYTRAFRAGEYIRVGDTDGTVMELGMFATRLRTGLGEEVLLPNTFVVQNTTKNYSRAVPGGGFVLDTTVTIGYSVPWRQVHAMLEEGARRTPGIAASPKPYVRQTGLSDFYVEYRLVAYSTVERPGQRADVLNQLHANIQDVFNEYGVQIMSPHYVIDPPEPQVVPKANWHLAPAHRAAAPDDDP